MNRVLFAVFAQAATPTSSPDPCVFNRTLPHTAEPTPEGGMQASFTIHHLDTDSLVAVPR